MSYKTEIPPLDTDTPATPPTLPKEDPAIRLSACIFLGNWVESAQPQPPLTEWSGRPPLPKPKAITLH